MSSTSGEYIPYPDRAKPMQDEDWCLADGCPSSICGGPHIKVTDAHGAEIVAPVRGFWTPGGGFWQFIVPTFPDYADWRDRLNNSSEEERIDAALAYMRHLMGIPEHKDSEGQQ